ncbi:MAG: ketopantoate reductase family protein [Acidimicrobiales bacterium]
MRFTIFGAGAIGGVIGGRLAQSGEDVQLVARGSHADAIGRHGLTVRSPEGDVTLQIPVVDSSAGIDGLDLRADDVVIIAVKSDATIGVIDALTRVAPPSTHIVCAQNGVENERVALRAFAHVQGMCVMMPAEHLEPGVVVAYSSPVPGLLDVGRFPGGIDGTTEAIAAALDGAGFESIARPDVMRWKYAKLLMNLGNVIEAASGPDARGLELASLARREGRACFEAAGIDFASGEEDRERRGDRISIGQIDGAVRGGGSTWQSLARSTGRIETDFLNGEIVLLGRLHGVATPVNEMLARLGHELIDTGAAPGSIDPDELAARLSSP